MMATESGTYTPETIARRLKMAESLLTGESPVRHWAQGLNELAKGYVGGTMFHNAEDAEKSGQSAQYAAIANILSGGAGLPTAGAGMAPAPAAEPSVSVPSSVGAPPADDTAPIVPKTVPTSPMPPVRQATEGAIIPQPDPYSEDTFRTPLDAMRPDRSAIAAALRGGAGPVALPPAPAGGPVPSPLPPAPTGAMAPPAATAEAPAPAPAPAPPTAAGSPDVKAQIAAMLRSPNPFVQRQGAALANQAIAGMIKSDGTDNIKNFEYAKKNGFPGNFLDFIQQEKARAGGKYGLQPIWGTDAEGKPVILQLSGTGEAGVAKLPQGVTPSAKNLMKVDTGTEIQMIDPVTRQVVSTTKKDIVGKESAEEVGKASGTAKVELPKVLDTANNIMTTLDKLQNHPGRENSTGTIMGRAPAVGGEQADFVTMFDQVKGQSFLEAYKTLRGGGAITDVEGNKATSAINRLSRVQSKAGFDEAINDLRAVVKQGVERAKKMAAAGAAGPAAVVPSATGRAADPLGIR